MFYVIAEYRAVYDGGKQVKPAETLVQPCETMADAESMVEQFTFASFGPMWEKYPNLKQDPFITQTVAK